MESNQTASRFLSKARILRWGIALSFVVIVLWLFTPPEEQPASSSAKAPLLKVSTLRVEPGLHRPRVTVVGVTQPRWPLTVVSAVEGRVDLAAEQVEPGDLITRDTLLVKIGDEAYAADVANTRASIRQAELEVARIKHEKTVAEQISSDKALSAFGRFEPHLASAQARLDAAVSARVQAEKRLEETRMLAPFDAILLSKQVVPGQWVNAGDTLLTLAASDSLDIRAELSSEQYRMLGGIGEQTTATVREQQGQQWHAQLRYAAPGYTEQTRQKPLVFFVEHPFSGPDTLSPNATVTVTLEGQAMEHVVEAPASILTPDGQVWVVENARLSKVDINLVEEFDDRVYLQFAQAPAKPRNIVRFPVSTLLEGQQVDPVTHVSVNDVTALTGAQSE